MNKLITKIITKIFITYDIILLTALIIIGFKNAKNFAGILIPFLFIPVFLYFTGGFFKKNKKINSILFSYSLFFSILILIIDLLSVKRFGNLLLVFMLAPVPSVLIYTAIQNIKNKPKTIINQSNCDTVLTDDPDESEDIDESKRKFLKLLASTGFATFFLYIFGAKKTQAAFFGNGTGGSNQIYLKDSDGNKINPAVSSPTDGFGICDIANVSTINYYGYQNQNGGWYILKEDSGNNNYTYASKINNSGVTNYSAAWSNKASSLVFGSFSDAF